MFWAQYPLFTGCVSSDRSNACREPDEEDLGAFCIADLESRTAVMAEIELSKIAVQVGFAAMLVNADHAALED
jgi:hypothetical protein